MLEIQGQRTRVLIVDSYAAVREGLSALLTSEEDFEVVGEADNVADAVLQAAVLRPDLLLLDLEMPALNGESTLDWLRGTTVSPVVVALGMNGDLSRQRRLTTGACQGYIQKGIRPEDVLRTIRTAMQDCQA